MTGSEIVNTAMERILEESDEMKEFLESIEETHGIGTLEDCFSALSKVIDLQPKVFQGLSSKEAFNIALLLGLTLWRDEEEKPSV